MSENEAERKRSLRLNHLRMRLPIDLKGSIGFHTKGGVRECLDVVIVVIF